MRRVKFGEPASLHREVVQLQRARLPADDDELIESTAAVGLWLTEWTRKDRPVAALFDHRGGTQRQSFGTTWAASVALPQGTSLFTGAYLHPLL